MATDMIIGYIYFIESNAGNQNWVHTVDSIDISGNYTEGTDFVKLEIPNIYKIKFHTGIKVVDSGGGASYADRTNRRGYALLTGGIETSRDNAETVRNFFMLESHCSGASATFKQYYMIIKYGTTDYEKFIDASGTPRDYCTGLIINGETSWDESEPNITMVKLNWKSVW